MFRFARTISQIFQRHSRHIPTLDTGEGAQTPSFGTLELCT